MPLPVPVIDPPVRLPHLELPALAERAEGFNVFWHREAPVTHIFREEFYKAWSPNKAAFLRRGFNIRILGERTFLYQSLDGPRGKHVLRPREEAIYTAASRPVRRQETLPLAFERQELICPALPAVIEEKLLEYQIPSARQILRALKNGKTEWGYEGAWDSSDAGCHAEGQLILMADGTLRRVEDIRVHESVAGWQGPQVVTSLTQGREEMARIVPVKGEPFTVNMSHLLTLQYSNSSPLSGGGKYSGQIIDITVRDYLALPATRRTQLKLLRCGVDYWSEKELPLNPYFLGLILGDGCTRGGALSISKPDPEIRDYIYSVAESVGARIYETKDPERCVAYIFRGCPAIKSVLRDLDLWCRLSGEKFIPLLYKTASTAQRAALLAGLLDTDGSLCCGGYDYISQSRALADDVAFVTRSLGLATCVKECQKTCTNTGKRGTYFRLHISGDCAFIPCRISRKKAPPRLQKKSVLRTGFRVERLPEANFYGFSLIGDGRFLLGDFTVTHNTGKTYVLAAVARASGMEVCVVCPKGVIGTHGRPGRPGAGWLHVLSLFGITPIFVEGYESLRTGKRKWLGKTGNGGRPFEFKIDPQDHILLWDESHRLKNPSSTRSLGFAALRQEFPCLFASATMAESPLNLGATGMAVGLHDGTPGGYSRFLAAHGCTKKGQEWEFNRYHKDAKRHLAAIHHTVFPRRGSRVRIADLGGMFPETQILLEGVSVENERAINEAFNLARTAIATMRRQGASEESLRKMGGAAYIEALHKCERAKVPGICEKAEEELDAGRSVAIFVNFSDVRIEIMRRLNARCGIYGGQSIEARNQAIADFQTDKARVIVCNIEAGGVGVSLHDVRGEFPRTALICMSNNAVTVTQTFGRVHRSGGKSKSRQLIIFAINTVEEDVVGNIRAKKEAIDTINDGDLNPYF